MTAATPERPGLRARKKARTRTDLQRAAFDLFRRQGYAATTMIQIADAADVSPSTLFRYFPTKESLVLWDELDLPILRAYAEQPLALAPVPALRAALANVLAGLTDQQRTDVTGRLRLVLDLPPIRAALLDQAAAGPMHQLAEVVASRTGRTADDLAVRTMVGAMTGAALAALVYAADHPEADVLDLVDTALSQLDSVGSFRPSLPQ
jgi:AcrR family transcriptional regulator